MSADLPPLAGARAGVDGAVKVTACQSGNARTCVDCPKVLHRETQGKRCRPCLLRWRQTDPEQRALQAAKVSAYMHRPEVKARYVEFARQRDYTPQRERRVAHGRAMAANLRGHNAKLTRAERVAAAAKMSETKLAWCPPEYRAEYRSLMRKHGMTLAEAKRLIADAVAADQRRAAAAETARLAAMTPHERNLERVRNGAQLVERVEFRRADHDFTLGGVSGGML